MVSTKARWADLVEEEPDAPTTLTHTQAANIISSLFLHWKLRRLAQSWQPVKGTRHTRDPPTKPVEIVKTHNPFDALQATPELPPAASVPPPVVRTKSCSA